MFGNNAEDEKKRVLLFGQKIKARAAALVGAGAALCVMRGERREPNKAVDDRVRAPWAPNIPTVWDFYFV